jgi:histone H3/H4
MSEKEVLVVVSKVKNYIREQSEMNTAASVASKISDIIRKACDDAIASARKDGRKTVMEKDFV